ncbi:hypothetical protein [Nocardioides bruguierae]|uniref:Uncharacterized protein n=1 Tax=Nocardioides bruguierae TaxID=2945102 RepID=A0A9X2D602_9ACTN|nr:hypothetical protein [Nocardioides bruguierae]MCM0619803.1 hypothetical protein [Nocardioides bruguierae]
MTGLTRPWRLTCTRCGGHALLTTAEAVGAWYRTHATTCPRTNGDHR